MNNHQKRCGTCAAWGAVDGEIARAPCLRIPANENQLDRPVIRIVNNMSDKPQPLARNVRLETPRDFGCPLHVEARAGADLISDEPW